MSGRMTSMAHVVDTDLNHARRPPSGRSGRFHRGGRSFVQVRADLGPWAQMS